MRSINVFGTVLGGDGYSNHTRQLVRAMYKQNKNIHLNAPKAEGWKLGCPDDLFTMFNNDNYNDGVTLAITMPDKWPLIWDNSKDFIGFLVWEGDKIPEFWLEYILDLKVKQVWVPSEHTKQAVLNTLKDCPPVFVHKTEITDFIKVVPHGVNTELFKPGEIKVVKKTKDSVSLEIPEDAYEKPFTFIMNKGWRAGMNDRGGVQYGIKAFCEEFKEDENVRMMVKINPSYNGPQWNLANELKKIGVYKQPKNLLINSDMLPFDQLPNLYNQGDCFVSPTMAEAFNLPVAEAMSCGLPIITTDFGGQTDYVPKNNWIVETTKIQANDGVMYEDIQWALPSMKILKSYMREAFNDAQRCKRVGEENVKFIQNWTWKQSADKALKCISEL